MKDIHDPTFPENLMDSEIRIAIKYLDPDTVEQAPVVSDREIFLSWAAITIAFGILTAYVWAS
jgi:hypothetical protein